MKKILKEFKENTWNRADEAIARQYTKITKKWEEKGHSRYSLTFLSDLSSLGAALFYSVSSFFIYDFLRGFIHGTINWSNLYIDVIGLGTGNHQGIKEDVNKKIISDPAANELNKLMSSIRLPLFVAGASLVGKAGVQAYDYFANGSAINSAQATDDITKGISLLLSASSIYIRGSDNSLLEKQPMWKQAYNSLKEKIFSPNPVTEPVPIRANNSLEEKLW